jgi:hypothetical protein
MMHPKNARARLEHRRDTTRRNIDSSLFKEPVHLALTTGGCVNLPCSAASGLVFVDFLGQVTFYWLVVVSGVPPTSK